MAKVPRGLKRCGGGQRLKGLGAASSPSSPAPEEPRLAKNVNKEETVLAKQRLQDNSWPKQSSQAPTFIRKQVRPLCTHNNYRLQFTLVRAVLGQQAGRGCSWKPEPSVCRSTVPALGIIFWHAGA